MNAPQHARFLRGIGTFKCHDCGKTTRKVTMSNIERLCKRCEEIAMWENYVIDHDIRDGDKSVKQLATELWEKEQKKR